MVSILKAQKGQSFTEGIPEDRLADWPVSMLTASKFAHMIVKAGCNALMSCSYMLDKMTTEVYYSAKKTNKPHNKSDQVHQEKPG